VVDIAKARDIGPPQFKLDNGTCVGFSLLHTDSFLWRTQISQGFVFSRTRMVLKRVLARKTRAQVVSCDERNNEIDRKEKSIPLSSK
jgi:hypothetical protein